MGGVVLSETAKTDWRAEVQSLDEMRARWPAALVHVYDAEGVVEKGLIRPGEVAANRFIFDDGLWLIVSRERLPNNAVVLHVSASFPEDCRIADEIRLLGMTRGRKWAMGKWIGSIPTRVAELAGDPSLARNLQCIGRSAEGIPHFMDLLGRTAEAPPGSGK